MAPLQRALYVAGLPRPFWQCALQQAAQNSLHRVHSLNLSRSLEYCNTDNVSPNPYLSPNNTEVW